jgi:hypothetical protein
MLAAIIGIILIIVAVFMWVGHISVEHAIALLTGAIGILILLGGVVPWDYFRRRP